MKSLYIAAVWIYDLLFNRKMCCAILTKHVAAPDRHMLRCFYCSCGSLIIICIKIKHLSLCLRIINLWCYSWTPAKKLSHLLMKTSMISTKTNVTVIHFTLHWTMETHTKTFKKILLLITIKQKRMLKINLWAIKIDSLADNKWQHTAIICMTYMSSS